MLKAKRFLGFTRAEQLYVSAVFLLTIVVMVWLQSYPIRGTRTSRFRWSPDGDRIPLRGVERVANKRFIKWAADPVIVETVQEANKRQAKSLDEIIRLDKKWIEGQVGDEFINELLNNQCAVHLRQLQSERNSEKNLYGEIFVMDRQGCIVAMSGKTSDYWQGDEDKFVKAFADGAGAVFVDEADYDESTRSLLIQVSVPVLDPNTDRAIGVMTIGLHIGVIAEEI